MTINSDTVTLLRGSPVTVRLLQYFTHLLSRFPRLLAAPFSFFYTF